MKKIKIMKRQFLLSVIILGATISLAYTLNALNSIVHGQLYSYGLQFSPNWATPYWNVLTITQILIGVVAISMTVNIVLTWTQQRSGLNVKRITINQGPMTVARIVSWSLLIIGGAALVLSIVSASSILGFIGLGLVFWGAVLLYATPQVYVRSTLLDSTTLALFQTLDKFIKDGNYFGTGVYLPPRYLKDFESSQIYLTKKTITQLPTPEQVQHKEDESLGSNSDSTMLTPPGKELEKLFEKALGISFTKITLEQFASDLPRLMIEDLEVAEVVETQIKSPLIQVKIENSAYKNIAKTLGRLTPTINLLGCPVGSAIACAIAKASGKPVIVQKYETSEDSRTTTIEYRLLEESKQKETQQ